MWRIVLIVLAIVIGVMVIVAVGGMVLSSLQHWHLG